MLSKQISYTELSYSYLDHVGYLSVYEVLLPPQTLNSRFTTVQSLSSRSDYTPDSLNLRLNFSRVYLKLIG